MKKVSASDHLRRLALLWGPQTNPGRSGLTVRAIVTAAIAIADADGLDALAMRGVADKLEVGTMSLYTYISGKTELIDLMLDTVLGELYQSVDEPSQAGNWRDALRFIAQQNWKVYRQHPWMHQVSNARPVIGPHASLKYEAELRPLDKLGLSDLEMDATLTLILTHVEGCARAQADLERIRQDTGQTDVEWWVTQEPLLNQIMDSSHFPVGSRVGNAVGQAYQSAANPEHTFQFGLERILVGIDALIQSRQP